MAEDTLITSLNFNDAIIGKSLNDKKMGVDVSLGYLSGMPPELAEMAENHGNIGIAIMERGMGQHELDNTCQKLAGDCLNEDFDILITKSDYPFDARWYLIGDLLEMIELARKDRMSLPFSNFLYDELAEQLDKYKN